MNPVAVAAKGKGALSAARRAVSIAGHYGFDTARMERRLETVRRLVQPYGDAATLPVTAAALVRNPRPIVRFAEQGFEFPVHGLYHVDHLSLDPRAQERQLAEARQRFERAGVPTEGFRAPYLRWSADTMRALADAGYTYDSSQAYHWPIPPEIETDGYRRGLEFYASRSAEDHPVLPRIEGYLVRIPCCLPDDESVVDRLALPGPDAIAGLWLDVWKRTHARGELFTMQVHPERIGPCGPGIEAVLAAAEHAKPGVWIARLGEIAAWWHARADATVHTEHLDGDRWRIACEGPEGTTMLVRGVDVGVEWADGDRRVDGSVLELTSARRPFVGVHPLCPPTVTAFLRQQGYVVEQAASPSEHVIHIALRRFEPTDELLLLGELDAMHGPLVRLGRWPNGARSAVAVTGDVDALTIWDYAARFVGR